MSWFSEGFDGAVAGQDVSSESSGTYRFWLREKQKALVQFCDPVRIKVTVDDKVREMRSPFIIREHSIQLNGKWGNTFTCIAPLEDQTGEKCPLCQHDPKSVAQVAAFTVRVWQTYKDKDGAEKKVEGARRLLVLRTNSSQYKALLAQMADQEKESVRGMCFLVERSASVGTKKSPAVGDTWTPTQNPKRYVDDASQLAFPDDFEIIDYGIEFAPKSRAELLKTIGAAPDAESRPKSGSTKFEDADSVDY